MQLIQSVEISRFRSIESARLDNISDLCVLVGPNNAGKSNILRTLNLFFNEETDAEAGLDFLEDFHLPSPARKKKEISCTVTFQLPSNFRFRKGLEPVEQYLGSKSFSIRKTWGFTALEPKFEIQRPGHQFIAVHAADLEKVRQFLALISFRYLPNRAIPAEVLRAEGRSIQRELARRVSNYGDKEAVNSLLVNLQTHAEKMIRPISKQLSSLGTGLSGLELATPDDLTSVVTSSVFRTPLGTSGKVQDTALGAGLQAVLMFTVLHDLVDGAEFKNFGWKQAAVWAIEEPESALHHGLAVQLALLFRRYALEPDNRFQIVSTSHSQVFVEAATSGYLVDLDGTSMKTTVTSQPQRLLADDCNSGAITGFVPPALTHMFSPTVLVEGEHDARILARAAQILGVALAVRFVCPSELDKTLASDGITNVEEFLKRHSFSIAQRLPQYPFLVLIDWDQESKVPHLRQRYGVNGSSYVRAFAESWANPKIGASFRGIERFYSYRLLDKARAEGLAAIATTAQGGLVITPPDLAAAKADLTSLFLAEAERTDCDALRPALAWIEASIPN